MAVPRVKDDEERAPDPDYARRIFIERGVEPDPATGRYDEQAILDAIRDRGWVPEVHLGEDNEWEVWFADPTDPALSPNVVGSKPDRKDALMQALRAAVTWLTKAQYRQYFDETTRRMLGLSGDDFLRKLDAGELDRGDPTVVHLSIMRPSRV